MRLVLTVLMLSGIATVVSAQQPLSPCEEVRNNFAVTAGDLATQARGLERENATLKAKLVELEKKLADGKEKPTDEKKP